MTTATRTAFLTEYAAALVAAYPWAQNPEKLAKYMESVATTINTERTTANLTDSPAALAAFRAIGCKGKISYKALRALPA